MSAAELERWPPERSCRRMPKGEMERCLAHYTVLPANPGNPAGNGPRYRSTQGESAIKFRRPMHGSRLRPCIVKFS